jgi:CopG family transcriptional regulator, nickel-responsive regulator
MADVERIGVSVDGHLLKRFDRLLEKRGISNRSEAIRDLIRDHLVEAELDEDVMAMGSVTIVYDHQTRALASGLTKLQHHHSHHVISSMHVHIDEKHCMEIIVLKGRTGELRHIADRLIGAKGVLHGKLVTTSVDAFAENRGG